MQMFYNLGRTAEENVEEMMEVGSQLYKVITRKLFIHSLQVQCSLESVQRVWSDWAVYLRIDVVIKQIGYCLLQLV